MTDLSKLRIFVCTTPTHMQSSIDRLMGLAQETFNQIARGDRGRARCRTRLPAAQPITRRTGPEKRPPTKTLSSHWLIA